MNDVDVLMVSESDDQHVQIIADHMTKRSITYFWLQTDKVFEQANTWRIPRHSNLNKNSWTPTASTVWYRARSPIPSLQNNPIDSFVSQESQGILAALLDQYADIRWVSTRESLTAAKPKLTQIEKAKEFGLQVPDTILTNNEEDLLQFFELHDGRVVAKPVQTQVVEDKERNLVFGTRRLTRDEMNSSYSYTPCFAQEQIHISAEVRVVVFGDREYSFKMTPRTPAEDIKQLQLKQIEHEVYTLDRDIAVRLHNLVRSYGLEFAACDFLLTPDHQLIFLELNPNGQWLWLQYMTGFDLENRFIDFLLT